MNAYPPGDRELSKADWIARYGSEHLQSALADGYEATDLYIEERARFEYPGFSVSTETFIDVDSPTPDELLAAKHYPKARVATPRVFGGYGYYRGRRMLVIRQCFGTNMALVMKPSKARVPLDKPPWWRSLPIPGQPPQTEE